jgi:hypothetical protein
VISSSDQQIVIALRVAAAGIVVPPESRWVRERGTHRSAFATASLAVAIVALGAVVVTLRGEPRTVPASAPRSLAPSASPTSPSDARGQGGPLSPPPTFDVSDNAPWVQARAKAAPDFVVLRPTWLPRASDSASGCEIDLQILGPVTSSEEYHVAYVGSQSFPYRCSLSFNGHRDPNWRGNVANLSPAPLATFVVRGSVVYVRRATSSEPNSSETTYLAWREHGAVYEVFAQGFELSDLVRAVTSLEPVR